jgi:hypothetical protein
VAEVPLLGSFSVKHRRVISGDFGLIFHSYSSKNWKCYASMNPPVGRLPVNFAILSDMFTY